MNMMKRMKRFANTSWNDKVFIVANGLLLVFFFTITLYPMIYVLSASFSDPKAVASGEMVLWPVGPTMRAYQYILGYKEVWIGYANTFFYTIVGTFLSLITTLPCAYALSRKDLCGRKFFMKVFMITMYFSGGLIPTYLNMRDFGLINTRGAILIGGMITTYNIIVARTFFSNSIPWELHEAAFLDGCSDFKLFLKVVVPLSAPITVVLMLYYGVSQWNSYMDAMIYLRDRSKFPLQLFLKEILTMGQFNEAAMEEGILSMEDMEEMLRMAETANMIKYAIIVVATAPMLILYPCVQRYFEKGAMVGSVKG